MTEVYLLINSDFISNQCIYFIIHDFNISVSDSFMGMFCDRLINLLILFFEMMMKKLYHPFEQSMNLFKKFRFVFGNIKNRYYPFETNYTIKYFDQQRNFHIY